MFGLIIKDLAVMLNQLYINNSTYRALSGSSYMDLPVELKSPRKGLINIKNKAKTKTKNVFDGII